MAHRVSIEQLIARLSDESADWKHFGEEALRLYRQADDLYFTDVDFLCVVTDLIDRGIIPFMSAAQFVLITALVLTAQARIAEGRVTSTEPVGESPDRTPVPDIFGHALDDIDMEGI